MRGVRKTVLHWNWRSGRSPHRAARVGAGEAKRRDRTTESRKPNGMGWQDECLQGTYQKR